MLFENSMRQSDAALLHRGERYQKFTEQMIANGGAHAGPGPVDRYLQAKRSPPEMKAEIPLGIRSLILPQEKPPI
jgi:hypothetical protein